jgi:hypothetical protein
MRVPKISLSIAAFIILVFGCQRAAIAYRLRHDGVLLPPTAADNTSQTVSIAIKRARHETQKTTDCDISGDLLSLHWAGSVAQIAFHSQSFFAPPNDSRSQGGGMYVDPLIAISKFRSELVERQANGCLSEIENERLLRTIVETLPLPPAIAYFLELGSYDVTGYIDLTRDFRMQVTSPIYRPGSQPSANNLLGYETANYVFVGEGSESRTRMRLASATEMPIGGTPFEKQMVHNELRSLKTPAYFRLLFMTEEDTSNHLTRAVFLSAREQNKLAQAVPRHGTAPDAFCASLSISDLSCMVFPKNFGVSPELRIRVNHKDVFVPVGGMVQEALNLPNEEDPPSTLRVLRPFHGHLIPIKFDRPSRDILKLVLLPGDQLTF